MARTHTRRGAPACTSLHGASGYCQSASALRHGRLAGLRMRCSCFPPSALCIPCRSVRLRLALAQETQLLPALVARVAAAGEGGAPGAAEPPVVQEHVVVCALLGAFCGSINHVDVDADSCASGCVARCRCCDWRVFAAARWRWHPPPACGFQVSALASADRPLQACCTAGWRCLPRWLRTCSSGPSGGATCRCTAPAACCAASWISPAAAELLPAMQAPNQPGATPLPSHHPSCCAHRQRTRCGHRSQRGTRSSSGAGATCWRVWGTC